MHNGATRDRQIAETIRRLMTEQDFTASRLHRDTGIALPTLRRRLTGFSSFKLTELYEVATVLGTTPTAVLQEAEHSDVAA